MNCRAREDPAEFKKGLVAAVPFFAVEMIGSVHLFNSGILTLGCKMYSISLF